MKMSTGIKEIARLAGVSTATVSRALSHPDRVAEETRRQIMTLVEEHGYRANSFARSLRRRRSDTVLAVLPDLGNPFFSTILSSIQETLLAVGIDLLVTDSRSTHNTGRSPAAHLRAARADGLICLDGGLNAGLLEELSEGDIAGRVVFACEWPEGASFPTVRSDNRAGMQLGVDHLVALGHRDIAFLSGPAGNILTSERQQGFVAALQRHGLTLDDDRIAGGDFSMDAGYASARLFAQPIRPTAVVCSSDQLAIGLISGLRELGLSVPSDVSVVGFDDIGPAPYAVPALTTIRQDREALGRKAAQMLLKRLGSDICEQDETATLPVTLIERASTAPAPRNPF
jgi:LacI family repressor for deo operon, udp, cdd, tsx, nupC, and nupG